MDRAIRILVANRPKLMRELILSVFSDQPGIEIVGEVANDTEILDRVDKTAPDFLVIALDEPGKRPDICDKIFREHPQVRIIAVASDQNRSIGYWTSFDIHSDDIEPSEEGILNAVRQMAPGASGN
jgi:DNA-binding NarL/FixJ family response regulator